MANEFNELFVGREGKKSIVENIKREIYGSRKTLVRS